MNQFESFDGVRIAYHAWGTRDHNPPVVLHHAFVADAISNWVNTGFVDALLADGRWVVGIDARGHGHSDKPHDPKRYGEGSMARDVSALFDLLGSAQYDLVGYSMGAVVAAVTATRDFRVRRLVIGGVGGAVADRGGMDRRPNSTNPVISAMLVEDEAEIPPTPAGDFRRWADRLGADRAALVAVLRSTNSAPMALSQIAAETLVLVGADDVLSRRADELAAAIPGGKLVTVGGDHLGALRDPAFAPTIVDFLGA